MIKRLRIKFICINMTIVTIMLAVIFSMLYQSTKIQLDSSSMQMLERITLVNEPGPLPVQPQQKPPKNPGERIHLPNFSMTITDDGKIGEIRGEYKEYFSDSDLSVLASNVTVINETTGILKEYNLRYLRVPSKDNVQIIAFVDITTEQTILSNMVKAFAAVGALAFLVFFAISCFLSRWAVKPVERAWKQQKQFIADASHELKTPLTVIMTDAELLQEPECSENDRAQLCTGILTMAGQMRGLVESMLDLAKTDSLSMKTGTTNLPAKDSVDFSDVATNSAMVFEPVYFEKELTFSYEIEPSIDVLGDSGQLKQLVDILLDNASKYTTANGSVEMTLAKSSHNKCLLTVINDGLQICDEDLANLFKRFYRADKARQMNHSYGLGLSIAESISTAHKGKIWAESENGKNRFFVELPVK